MSLRSEKLEEMSECKNLGTIELSDDHKEAVKVMGAVTNLWRNIRMTIDVRARML